MIRTPYPRLFLISPYDVVRAIRASTIVAVLCGFSVVGAEAETVTFLGKALPVDSVVDVDATHVTITLGSETFITLKDQAGRRVAALDAANPDRARKLPWAHFAALAAAAASGPERDFAKIASRGVLTSADISDNELHEFLAEVTSAPPGRRIVAEELAAQTSPVRESSACNALVYVGSDGAVVKDLLRSSLSWMDERCPALLQSACQKAFQEGDTETAQRYLDTVNFLFSSESSAVQAMKIASERLRAMQDAFRSGQLERFESSLRVVSMDPVLKGGFATVAPTITLAFAQKQLDEKRAAAALRIIAMLDFSMRSNAHHEIVSKSLASITVDDASVFSIPSVQKLLWSYSSKDEEIKRSYIDLLSKLIREASGSSEAKIGIVLLSNLRELRPDPSAANNELRVVLGESLLKQGERDAGAKLLAEAGVSASNSLTWARFVVPFVVGIIGVLAALFIFRHKERTRDDSQESPQKKATGAHDNSDQESQTGRSARSFVAYARDPIAASGEASEYEELLAKFSLQVGAKASDIKLAYRNAVKSYHPDLNPDGGQREADMFIMLTKTYERLLELHQELERRGGL